MKKTLHVYFTDWREIFAIPSAVLLIFGLIVLPSVYAWVNIKAMWDPYENTSGVKIAISNDDEGAMLQDQRINIGRQVVRNLKNNHKLGWTFVDKDKAHDGVMKGKYYASLYIPKNFSKKIASIASDNPEKPQVVYTVNEKVNAVSPKITKSGVSTIINQVSDSFTKSVGNAIFSKFNQAGITLERELPTIRNFEQKLFALEKELPEISRMGKKVTALDQKLSELKKKTQPIKDFQHNVPNMDQLGEVILKTEANLPQIKNMLDQIVPLQDNLTQLQDSESATASLQNIITDLETSVDEAIQKGKEAQSSQPDIPNNRDELVKIKEDLQNIKSGVQENGDALSKESVAYASPFQELSTFAQQDWPLLEQNIKEAARFVREDWPGVKKNIEHAATLMETEIPKIENAIHKAALMTKRDLPALEQSIKRTADKIREFERNNNLSDIINVLKNDARKESDFLASPIKLKEKKIFPIPNYGSAMTPFYTLLALWVGSMLLVSSLKVGEIIVEKEYDRSLFFGRLLSFITIGLLQALIVSLGDLFIIHAHIADKLWFVLFTMFISIIFIMITYTLVSLFGNIGKGLAVIFLVLQFSSSGGTFPVSMTSPFFQKLNPFMPFTYGVSLLREATGGIIWDVVVSDLYHLLIFAALSLLAGALLSKPLHRLFSSKGNRARKARILQ